MAPKDKIENPPAAASSSEEEEEEEESGSSVEASGSSSDDEAGHVQSKLTQKPPKKKPDSDSEEDESDSDSAPPTKTKPLNAVVTSGSVPESSTAKRSLKQADEEPKNKKVKTSATEQEVVKKISGEDAKKMFQRLFSETDEIAMLQGFLDFTSTRGDPYENMDAFCDYVKTLIDFNASKAQIVTKLQRCKKKFVNIVKNALKKGRTEDKVTCSKDLDQKAFELSRKIWGANGVLPAKPRKKFNDVVKSPPSPSHTPKKEVEKRKGSVVVDAQLSSSREVALFFKAANVSVFGLDESTVSAVWDMVEDGAKKREVEEKLKKLKDMQVELCLQRTALLDTTAKMIFKDNASSST
ncbi:hypothetical protein HID58_001492 [Brassica napus]|uniref:(rape) hypothetical protein n=1 Tax=Brassica napus TaxID=3708 RepID=A0A816XPZ1_BRANA|nr:GLABROUS1 enhancer-binding protein-like [Brassica napus]KAH0941855.1 hypothetical protein HID58_001492 [Brassica napus]CAF2149769.1 unnamed protein product [Brassica napus]